MSVRRVMSSALAVVLITMLALAGLALGTTITPSFANAQEGCEQDECEHASYPWEVDRCVDNSGHSTQCNFGKSDDCVTNGC